MAVISCTTMSSSGVVREAVRGLEPKGLVGVRRRVGITVRPAVARNALDGDIIRWQLAGPDRLRHFARLSTLRVAIEPIAASLAAENANAEQCDRLATAVIGMSGTARAADQEIYLQHDAGFHRTLLEASGNAYFAGLADVVVELLTGRTHHGLMPAVTEGWPGRRSVSRPVGIRTALDACRLLARGAPNSDAVDSSPHLVSSGSLSTGRHRGTRVPSRRAAR
ncbi:FCD domain-containing protein [Pseudonocardia sp. NPDC046786]|uniref:FadR/GntR family transcriptional regulator n=1 Tax=Pseudonocardia sp. NPDC046786 TaxID=3155471 RepID=UPI0033D0630D